MAVIRVNKSRDYTVMSNAHFKEREMTLKAKGLLSLMLSLPDEWDYSIAGLAALSKDGKDSVMNALSELEDFGYLKRVKLTNEKGQFAGYEYNVFESPRTENPNEDKPYPENPNTDKPNAENPPQLNTNTLNTKKSNTKKNNIYHREIVEYLNQKAGMQYRSGSKATQQHINARLAEGYTVEDFKTVIDKKCADWKGTDYEQYLRPSTLFGTKFENYLNAARSTRTNQNQQTQQNGQQFQFSSKYDI